jgi:hypothetical protein
MIIPGVADDQLVWDHWNYGIAKGGSLRLLHLPSGVFVSRKCFDRPILQLRREMVTKLTEKLQDAGLISGSRMDDGCSKIVADMSEICFAILNPRSQSSILG